MTLPVTCRVLRLAALLSLLPVSHALADSAVAGNELMRVLTLRDHNTRVVVLGTTLLGAASGLVGTFMLLRKRSLLADALSHATLPGIAAAFIILTAVGFERKSLPPLLLGASIAGAIGVGAVLAIRHHTRLKEDAALGIVLSVFFGIGVALMGIIQQMGTGHAAGLESFIYGKTASMLTNDAMLIAVAAAVVALLSVLLFKEFAVVCFDQEYAGTQGWPVLFLDVVMMCMVIAVTVIGLQAVGLILIIALLIIPPASARFWTDHLGALIVGAAGLGAVSGLIGSALSALLPRMPAGAVIVLVAGVFFMVSLIFGRRRGMLMRILEHVRLTRKIGLQHLLRTIFEACEPAGTAAVPLRREMLTVEGVSLDRLLALRAWTPGQLRRSLRQGIRREFVREGAGRSYHLTETGFDEARRLIRSHRLWELYLMTYADVATGLVDRDADTLEHVLDPVILQQLEALMAAETDQPATPPSPHPIQA